MATIQASAQSGEEISSNARLSPRHSVTAGLYSHSAIGSESGPGSQWSISRMLPPIQQSTLSSTYADASFSRVYPPALETHQLSQLQAESDSRSLKEHHPNKKRRLSGTIPSRPQTHPLGFADSPQPRSHSDRSGHLPSPRPDLTPSDPLVRLLSDPTNHLSKHSPHSGRPDWPQHAYSHLTGREDQCCPIGCQGPKCSIVRRIARELFMEIDARFPESSTTPDPDARRIREVSRARLMSCSSHAFYLTRTDSSVY